jgi:hypothetical protein
MVKIHFCLSNPELNPSWTHLGHIRQLAESSQSTQYCLTSSPSDADRIVFIDCHQMDTNVKTTLQSSKVYRAYQDKCLVYDERDRPDYSIRGIYVNTPTFFKATSTICPSEYFRVSTDLKIPKTFSEPPWLATFRGSRSHWTRSKMLRWNDSRIDLLDTTNTTNQYTDLDNESVYNTYVQSLMKSKIVLCPRGHGMSSFRFFEAVVFGGIPCLISDHLRLPPYFVNGVHFTRLHEKLVHNEQAFVKQLLHLTNNGYNEKPALPVDKFERMCSQIMCVDMTGTPTLPAAYNIASRFVHRVHSRISRCYVDRPV